MNFHPMTANTRTKIANKVRVLMKPEFGEVEEPIKESTVGSSTVPHKGNPNLSEETVALGKILHSYSGTMLEAMETEHGCDIGTWRCDFLTLPESCLTFSAALRNTRDMLEGLNMFLG